MTVNESIVKEVSQLQRQLAETGVVLRIDMNAVMGLAEPRKNAFKFSLVAF